MSFDPTDIGSVVGVMYAALSGPAGARDWSDQEQAFHLQALLVRTGVDEFGAPWAKVMTLAEYRQNVAYFFSKVPFFEFEIERRVQEFGNIAQVWSTYEEKRAPDAKDVERRGVNSIQLIRDESGHWRIMSVVWDNEREGLKLA
ncbi:MAG: hypothetical protein NW206_05935 [Hyphomonadaceae bacterium]|nr:hypothetical protein [Hyphomonadaceae bacterium]